MTRFWEEVINLCKFEHGAGFTNCRGMNQQRAACVRIELEQVVKAPAARPVKSGRCSCMVLQASERA